jgi:hypothetical protein
MKMLKECKRSVFLVMVLALLIYIWGYPTLMCEFTNGCGYAWTCRYTCSGLSSVV